MVCKRCGTEFDGAFCPNCGERAEAKMTVCPVCGKERAEGENFCAKCGYAFEGQATVTQKPQVKITFDKEALIGGVRKFYKVALNIGKVFFSLLLLLILASPIMLHEGINTAGNGYTNAFNLYVDGRFTAVCAILMIIAFYSLIYGVYACVKFFVFRNKAENKASKIIYFAANFLVFIVCCIGCSGAGEWFADAGAGLSFGIFVGIVGMALSVLRYLFEDKFVDADGSQSVEVSDDVKAVEKKATKKVKLGTAVVTGALVIAVVITSIVQSVYTNPFSSASYGFAETRADVVKQFGMLENAKEDSSSYTYYSTEYAAAERMIDALIAAQDKQLTDGFESDADSFDEDDLESMFDGAMGIDGIIEKLEEKQDNIKYKKSTVVFNNDGGENRNNDTVKSYVCEVVTPEVEGEEKEERTLKKFDLISGSCIGYTKTIYLEYFAKYDDGSFIKDTATLNYQDNMPKNVEFTDIFGKYEVETRDIDIIELINECAYVYKDTLYVVADVEKSLHGGSEDVKKIVIQEGVESICDDAFDSYENAVTITIPQSLKSITKYAIDETAYYKIDNNWENGNALYFGNILIEVKDVSDREIVLRENVEKIAKYACNARHSLTKITIPAGVTSIGKEAFKNCKALTVYCEATSKPDSWDNDWTDCLVVWDCNNNDVASDGYIYYVAENGVRYALKDGSATVARQSEGLSGDIEIPSSISYKGNAYTVTSIGSSAFYNCSSLTSITIPSSVTSIGSDAFYYCSSLCDINVSENNANYKSADGNLYSKDMTELIQYAIGKSDTSFTIPDGVTSIGDCAFRDCRSLTSITIPSSVTSIGSNAFRDCRSLTSIMIPDSVTSIGSSAFQDCSSLTSITIPDSVTSIGYSAFQNCSSLTRITIPDSVTSIGSYAFWGCSSLTSITIPDSVTNIDRNAFVFCNSLTSVIFENTQGWWYSNSSSATSGTSISSSDLADPAKAAKYLTDTYYNYYWKRG